MPSSRNRVTRVSPPTMMRRAVAMSWVSTPRLAARSRSISHAQFGFVQARVVSASSNPKFRRLLAQAFGVRGQRIQIGPEQGKIDVEVGAASHKGLRIANGNADVRECA